MWLLLPVALAFEGLHPTSTWRYWDGGALSGSPAWYDTAYDDSAWSSGDAPLGFGGDVTTSVAAHGGFTWYFRTTFDVADAGAVSEALLDLEIDDGAVVYLNGAEVGRWNMPSTAISATTPASTATLSPLSWVDQVVDPGDLVDGENLLAVEVHQRSTSSSDLHLELGLSLAPHVVAGPWVVHAGSDTLTIGWESRAPDAGTVSWGLDSSYGNVDSDSVSDTLHFVTLTGLDAATTYHYAVTADGWTSGDLTVTTLPEPGAPELRIGLYGDSRSQPDVHAAIAERVAAADPDLVLHSGDFVDEPELDHNWYRQVFDPMAAYLSSTPFVPVPGNHETEITYPATWYWDFFPSPEPTNWWSTVAGPVRLIQLDSNDPDYADGDPTDSAQWAWLVAELAAATEPYVVVTQHHPVWSSGFHATDTSVQGFQTWLAPLLEAEGVTAFIAGHDHRYERSLSGGTHYLTVGGGGASLQPACNPAVWGSLCDNPYQQAVADSYCYGLLSFSEDAVWFEVFDDTGTALEPPVLLAGGGGGGAPTVEVTGPDGVCDTVDADLVVDAVVADADSTATVSVGLDADAAGCDGTLLETGLAEADGAASWTVDTSAVADGDWYVYVVADDGTSTTCAYAPGPVRVSHPTTAGTTLLALGSTWSWSATGALPAANWYRANYNDSAWSTGCGELGYGDGDEETVLGTVTTAYFRQDFTWSGPTPSALVVEAAIDDGAVIYLNGREVRRIRMAAGAVSYATWASQTGEGAPRVVSTLQATAPGYLVSGSNTLAVEVHQRNAASSDLSFDLRLVAVP